MRRDRTGTDRDWTRDSCDPGRFPSNLEALTATEYQQYCQWCPVGRRRQYLGLRRVLPVAHGGGAARDNQRHPNIHARQHHAESLQRPSWRETIPSELRVVA